MSTEAPVLVRPFAPDADLPLLVRLRAEAESIDQSGEDVGEEALCAQLAWPGHDPARDRWVAVPRDDADRLVGCALVWKPPADRCAELDERLSARRGQPTGHLDAPGIVPALRDKGLHRPLLLAALRWLRTRQPAAFELESWGDSAQILALYQQMGFTLARQATSYRLDLG
jgi:ribosomal protein S18 acetylase RimI-like enzyme